ncbi:hypothetical protein D6853_11315 [Butyrivibrio sp. X503]|uniref:hypothetical protein n=1 Tax=Butyrivibrio sp. X503 TaxID=2364878 RepID=UPI000EA86273|nr:hypothetical protein [Butyrivibrio sp. X503]RKM55299.1 hypothetical protein D6853_11315 [Butyrivibrio sp. X503]
MRKRFFICACISALLLTACGGAKATSKYAVSVEDAEHFVEKAAQKEIFESYDEVISYLTKGQSYAYIRLNGYDGELLMVTVNVCADDNEDRNPLELYYTIFAKDGNDVSSIGDKYFYGGKECPLAIGDGMLFSCAPDEIVSYSVYDDSTTGEMFLVHMASLSKYYHEDGEPYCLGFVSDPNDPIWSIDADPEEAYAEWEQKYSNAKKIKFTVVK